MTMARKKDIPDLPAESAVDAAHTLVAIDRIVGFLLNGQRYALPIGRVREIQQIVAFADVPSGSNGVVGMINLRGHVIPAVDMHCLVGLEPLERTLATPMIIAETHDHLVALLVDEVLDVFELSPECLQEAPALHQLGMCMIGVARLDDGLVYILDPDRLIGAGMLEQGCA